MLDFQSLSYRSGPDDFTATFCITLWHNNMANLLGTANTTVPTPPNTTVPTPPMPAATGQHITKLWITVFVFDALRSNFRCNGTTKCKYTSSFMNADLFQHHPTRFSNIHIGWFFDINKLVPIPVLTIAEVKPSSVMNGFLLLNLPRINLPACVIETQVFHSTFTVWRLFCLLCILKQRNFHQIITQLPRFDVKLRG